MQTISEKSGDGGSKIVIILNKHWFQENNIRCNGTCAGNQ